MGAGDGKGCRGGGGGGIKIVWNKPWCRPGLRLHLTRVCFGCFGADAGTHARPFALQENARWWVGRLRTRPLSPPRACLPQQQTTLPHAAAHTHTLQRSTNGHMCPPVQTKNTATGRDADPHSSTASMAFMYMYRHMRGRIDIYVTYPGGSKSKPVRKWTCSCLSVACLARIYAHGTRTRSCGGTGNHALIERAPGVVRQQGCAAHD